MGIYLNPTNEGFWTAVRSEIYVDKTGLLACTNRYLNTEQKYFCVSRPRRFGKSMALKMLAAYYSSSCDSKELFAGLKIEESKSYSEYLNRFDVILLNMQQFVIRARDSGMIEYLERVVLEDIREIYGDWLPQDTIVLAEALERIYAKTGKQFVFLIDEWDCVMRERQDSEALQKEYLDFLRNLLKDQAYVALAYMTGILPVKKYGQHSALNMFWEYSMTDQAFLEEYTGFTEEEVRGLCQRFSMNYEETKAWYDGYQLTEFKHVYNPKSVVESMLRRRFSNYWTSTETYDALKIYMDMDFDGLRADVIGMLGGERVRVNTRSFQNDMCTFRTKDDVLTLLIHLGYLGYDSVEREAFIPNKEISEEFENAMSVGGWAEVMNVLRASERLLEDTLRGDEKRVAEGLDRAHREVASILTYNDESCLGAAVSLAYYSARRDYRMIREFPTGRGVADVVFLPLPGRRKPAIVVELKFDKSASAALAQIRERQYTRALEGYSGEILLVGVNYDKDSSEKMHSCVIERVE